MNGSAHYPSVDVSRSTSGSVTGDRRIKPVGSCIHHTDGVNSLAWLTGDSAKQGTPASADCLVSKQGNRKLLIPSDQYAYGVGVTASSLKAFLNASGNINEYLLSVELEYKSLEGPTFAQIDSCAEQLVLWARQYAWQWPFIIFGHYGIASPVGRRSDPYLFDWGSFMGRLYAHAKNANVIGL